MSITSVKKGDYVLVELPTGMDYCEIIERIDSLFPMPDFKHKDSIWVCGTDQVSMAYTDIYEIKDFAIKRCPNDLKGIRTAIVVRNCFQESLAALFCVICDDLPIEIRVFSEIESATEWISN
jgi:hypothetical protein